MSNVPQFESPPYQFKNRICVISKLGYEIKQLCPEAVNIVLQYIFNVANQQQMRFYINSLEQLPPKSQLKYPLLISVIEDPQKNISHIKYITSHKELENIGMIQPLINGYNHSTLTQVLDQIKVNKDLCSLRQLSPVKSQSVSYEEEQNMAVMSEEKLRQYYSKRILDYFGRFMMNIFREFQRCFQQKDQIRTKFIDQYKRFLQDLPQTSQIFLDYNKSKLHISEHSQADDILIHHKHPANIMVEGRQFIDALIESADFVQRWGKISILEARLQPGWQKWIREHKKNLLLGHPDWMKLNQKSKNIILSDEVDHLRELQCDQQFAQDREWLKFVTIRQHFLLKKNFKDTYLNNPFFKKSMESFNNQKKSTKFTEKKIQNCLRQPLTVYKNFKKEFQLIQKLMNILRDSFFRMNFKQSFDRQVGKLSEFLRMEKLKLLSYLDNHLQQKIDEAPRQKLIKKQSSEIIQCNKQKGQPSQIKRVLSKVKLLRYSQSNTKQLLDSIEHKINQIQSLYNQQITMAEQIHNSLVYVSINSGKSLHTWNKKQIQIAVQSIFSRNFAWQVYEKQILAIMDRAFQLCTSKRLRITQMVSILLFLSQQGSKYVNYIKGHISQIKTGEGKTTIIAFLAAVKALKGKLTKTIDCYPKVDVITSNSVLAQEAAKQFRQFYRILNLSVSHNNQKDLIGPKPCYDANIVYGTISNFQFDFLRDRLQKAGIMKGRKIEHNWVILDEIDSLVLDRGGNLTKVSQQYAGMDGLKLVYLKIWNYVMVNKSPKGYQLSEDQLTILDIIVKNDETRLNARMQELQNKLITKDRLLPHIEQYARKQLKTWIINCIQALCTFKQDIQYKVVKGKSFSQIIPVDNQQTGQSLEKTIFSNGVHQFLQIKHNIRLSSESLTSNLISNLGFIKMYGNKILGLTGTLGSQAQQQMFFKLYGVNISKIPPFKHSKIVNYGGMVVDKKNHLQKVIELALSQTINYSKINQSNLLVSQINQGQQTESRAVLAIFKSIQEVNSAEMLLKIQIQKRLQPYGIEIKVKTYRDEQESKITQQLIQPSTIILATNISGRGTDFKTTPQLQRNGGLHVIIAFLPKNKRVHDQASGRTARKGESGSFQTVMSSEQFHSFCIDSDELYSYEEMVKIRDELQKSRIQNIIENKVAYLQLNDKLFQHFSEYYENVSKRPFQHQEKTSILNDLKQRWAFYYYYQCQKFKAQEYKIPNATEIFQRFKAQSQNLSIDNLFNPCSIIQAVQCYMKKGSWAKATRCLQFYSHNQNNNYALSFIYIKLFQIQISSNEVIMKRIWDALKSLNIFNKEKEPKITNFHQQRLLKAIRTLDLEKKEYQQLFGIQTTPKGQVLLADSLTLQGIAQDSELTKFVCIRVSCLNIFITGINEVIEKAQLAKLRDNSYLYFSVCEHNFLSRLKKQAEKDKRQWITTDDIIQFELIGLETYYTLNKLYEVPPTVLQNAVYMITGGIVSIGISVCWPITAPFMIQLAINLIFQGLMDIITALLSKGDQGFDEKCYNSKKLTFAASTFISCLTYQLMASKAFIQMMIKCTTRLKTMTKGIRYLNTVVQKIHTYFLTALQAVELRQLQLANAILKSLKQRTKQVFKDVGYVIAQRILPQLRVRRFQILQEKGIDLLRYLFGKRILSLVRQQIINQFQACTLQVNLQSLFMENIDIAIDVVKREFLAFIQPQAQQNSFKDCFLNQLKNVAQEVLSGNQAQSQSESWRSNLAFSVIQTALNFIKLSNLFATSVNIFIQQLRKLPADFKAQDCIFIWQNKSKKDICIEKLSNEITKILINYLFNTCKEGVFKAMDIVKQYKEAKDRLKDKDKDKDKEKDKDKDNQVQPIEHISLREGGAQQSLALDAQQSLAAILQVNPEEINSAGIAFSSQENAQLNDFRYALQDLDVLVDEKNIKNLQQLETSLMFQQSCSDRGLLVIKSKGESQKQYAFAILNQGGRIIVKKSSAQVGLQNLTEIIKNLSQIQYKVVLIKDSNEKSLKQAQDRLWFLKMENISKKQNQSKQNCPENIQQ